MVVALLSTYFGLADLLRNLIHGHVSYLTSTSLRYSTLVNNAGTEEPGEYEVSLASYRYARDFCGVFRKRPPPYSTCVSFRQMAQAVVVDPIIRNAFCVLLINLII